MSYPSNEKVLQNTAHFLATKGESSPSQKTIKFVEAMYYMSERKKND